VPSLIPIAPRAVLPFPSLPFPSRAVPSIAGAACVPVWRVPSAPCAALAHGSAREIGALDMGRGTPGEEEGRHARGGGCLLLFLFFLGTTPLNN